MLDIYFEVHSFYRNFLSAVYFFFFLVISFFHGKKKEKETKGK